MGAERDRGPAGRAAGPPRLAGGCATRSVPRTSRRRRRKPRWRWSALPSKSCSSTRRSWRPASAPTAPPARRRASASPASRSGAGSTRCPSSRPGTSCAAFDEIDADLDSGEPMQRLLMGEVGSGKTVVAVYAMLRALEAGFQAVLMAPTETLAEQHAITLGRLLAAEATPFALLTGSTPAPSPPAGPGPARQRRAGTHPGHPRADRADRRSSPASASAWSTSSTASGSSSAAPSTPRGWRGWRPTSST